MSESWQKSVIDALGATALLAYAAMALLSYIHAPALWDPSFAPKATAFFTQLYGQPHMNAIRAFFAEPFTVILSQAMPLAVATLAAIACIFVIARSRRDSDDAIARRVMAWSFAFAGISFFAYPVFTQDFWLSAVWGDMIISGVNPYYHNFTPEIIGLFPLDHFPMTMSYGPLWALVSATIMALAGGSVFAAGLMFKAVLTAAWCALIFLTDRVIRDVSPVNRSLTLAVLGWLPLGVMQTVAEGHNDIMLALPALLWIALLLRKKFTAPLALAASTLCKYTTAPLFLIDAMHSIRANRMTVRAYALRLLPAALFGLAIIAVFYRSFAYFDGILLVGSWHFMQPDDAFLALTSVIGNWIAPFSQFLTAIFPIIAIRQCIRYWNKPDTDELIRSALALMCAVSFSLISHLWPWYLVWTLPLAALQPRWWLSRFVIGLALFAPFTAVVWWVPEAEEFKNHAAFAMYMAAFFWTLTTVHEDPAKPASTSLEKCDGWTLLAARTKRPIPPA